MVPDFNEDRARVAGINRTDLAQTLEFRYPVYAVGFHREHDKQIPIVVRPPADERFNLEPSNDRYDLERYG
ncbi:hypothetical protein [Alishewanella longhuensis]